MNNLKWRFSSNNYSERKGLNDAGIETFSGSIFSSLAREICQNSLDAISDPNKPVRVEFSKFDIKRDLVPDIDKLAKAIQCCMQTFNDAHNKNFFATADALISRTEKIPCLRISDFNTKGLEGSDEYDSKTPTAWSSLVKSSGVSSKTGSAGGSFGIGKSAVYVISKLRTVFYSTLDCYGKKACEGVAKLPSFEWDEFEEEQDKFTSGTGYCSVDKKNSPLTKMLDIGCDFTRDEPGTDIYVIGIYDDDDWKENIIKSVIINFLVAIFEEMLTVIVGETEISSKTLGDLIKKYEEKDKELTNTSHYYNVLKSGKEPKIISIGDNIGEIGEVELTYNIDAKGSENFNRKILICRKNGMKIFEQGNISSSNQFTGICILREENINEFFRKMENPQHNDWEPDRITNKKERDRANKIKKNFKKKIKEEINTSFDIDTSERIDFAGVGRYLSDISELDGNSQKNENLDQSITSIKTIIPTLNKNIKGKQERLGAINKGDINSYVDYDATEEGFGGKDSNDDNPNAQHKGTGYGEKLGSNEGHNREKEGIFSSDTNKEEKVFLLPMKSRIFVKDKQNKIYSLSFSSDFNRKNCHIEINLLGEQKTKKPIKAKVIDAFDFDNKKYKCSDNKIYIGSVDKDKQNKIFVKLNVLPDCSLEVCLYGN